MQADSRVTIPALKGKIAGDSKGRIKGRWFAFTTAASPELCAHRHALAAVSEYSQM